MPVESPERLSRSEKTKKLILRNASKVFFERGIRTVSVEELCEIIPVSKGTFYRYYYNRDVLVEALIDEIISQLWPAITENLNSNNDFREIIETHYNLVLDFLLHSVSAQMLADIESHMPELWRRIQEFVRAGRKALIKLFGQGQREGIIRKDLDLEVMSILIEETLGSVSDTRFLVSNGLALHQVATTIKNIILNGILLEAEA